MVLLEGLFRLVLCLSLAGSAAVLLVLGTKAVLKDRLEISWNYYIWILPLILYLVPFALPLPTLTAGGASAGAEGMGAGITQGASAAAGGELAQAVQEAAEAAQTLPSLEERLMDWGGQLLPVLAWAWVLGMVFTLAVRLVDSHSLGASLKKCAAPPSPEGRAQKKFQEALEEQGIPEGRVELVICPGVESPLLLGLWKARVVIPREDYSDARLAMMFRHELTHYRYHDLWYKAVALVVASVHWFNPLVRILLRDLDRSCELCCDRRTTREMNASGRRQYGRMLLDVAQGNGESREDQLAPSGGAFLAMNKKELKRRLSQLRAPVSATLLDRAVAGALGLTVAAVGVVCSSAANPGPVFQELFPEKETLPVLSSSGKEEVPELWSEEISQPDTIPQPNPTDVTPQEPLQMQVVLSDEIQAEVDRAAEEAAAAEAAAAEEAARKAQEAQEQAAAAEAALQAETAAQEGENPEDPQLVAAQEPEEDAVDQLSWDGSFLWPVNGGSITCGFYGYYGHDAVDIAADAGTEIYAAASGIVSTARDVSIWPYGKMVTIQHGDGVETLYAHCSSVLVSEGDYVEAGDVIALVGRTGNATGNHCHFEIHINGVSKNPVDYIGSFHP
jgi:murein DD-endopeptidase MepM/ murein hydrolase activator NlpD